MNGFIQRAEKRVSSAAALEAAYTASERKQPSTGEPSEFSESPEKRALGSLVC